MRRADRLFQIIQIMRAGRPGTIVTAARLASELEVSERTIYRDIADLQANRVPIEGEAGIGYMLRAGYDLPPLMFTREELTALLVGARLLAGFGGQQMATATARALDKIETVLPEELKNLAKQTPVYAFHPQLDGEEKKILDQCNQAVNEKKVLLIRYETANGEFTSREIEPLGLIYWGKVWTLVAWCRLRDDFRSFRPDRMKAVTMKSEQFSPHPGKTLLSWLENHAEAEEREIPPQFLK